MSLPFPRRGSVVEHGRGMVCSFAPWEVPMVQNVGHRDNVYRRRLLTRRLHTLQDDGASDMRVTPPRRDVDGMRASDRDNRRDPEDSSATSPFTGLCVGRCTASLWGRRIKSVTTSDSAAFALSQLGEVRLRVVVQLGMGNHLLSVALYPRKSVVDTTPCCHAEVTEAINNMRLRKVSQLHQSVLRQHSRLIRSIRCTRGGERITGGSRFSQTLTGNDIGEETPPGEAACCCR